MCTAQAALQVTSSRSQFLPIRVVDCILTNLCIARAGWSFSDPRAYSFVMLVGQACQVYCMWHGAYCRADTRWPNVFMGKITRSERSGSTNTQDSGARRLTSAQHGLRAELYNRLEVLAHFVSVSLSLCYYVSPAHYVSLARCLFSSLRLSSSLPLSL